MRLLQILVLTLGLAVVGSAQKSILTGSVYDANGAVIPGAKITVADVKGEKFETKTNNEGVYVLNLPFNPYDTTKSGTGFRIAKYKITVEGLDFEKSILNDFRFAPSFQGKMNLDFALDVAANDSCEPAGCPELLPVESPNIKLSDKISTMPLEELPKALKPK